MQNNQPNNVVLQAFRAKGKPQPLSGGEGTSFLVDNLVFKPVTNVQEMSWIAEVMSQVVADGFRVARPAKSKEGNWVEMGWQAYHLVNGKEIKGRWREKVAMTRKFQKALLDFKKPDFLDGRNNPWSIADRMVWGEEKMEYSKRLAGIVSRLLAIMEPGTYCFQLIHGDMTGNILFDEKESPAIIDFSPYWRPAEFATAIVMVDSIVWEKAPLSLLKEMPHTFENIQLMIRAALWRIITTEQCIKAFGHGDINEVDAYADLITILDNSQEFCRQHH